MSQFERRFFRLEEVPDRTNLTKWDVLDAVDNEQIPFCGLIDARNLGAIHPDRGVAGIFDYNGVVRFLPSVSKSFSLSLETQCCQHAIILEPENIRRWRSVHEAFDNVQEMDFNCSDITMNPPRVPIVAYARIKASLTASSLAGEYADRFSKAFPNELAEELTRQFPKVGAQQLKASSIQVRPNQLRIDVEDLIRVFGEHVISSSGYGSVRCIDSTVTSTVASTVINTVTTRLGSVNVGAESGVTPVTGSAYGRLDSVAQPLPTHPIEQIAYRILSANPQARADKVWTLLRQDVSQHDFNRQYDVDVVIESMTQDSVSWFGRGDSENTMSYDSFRKNVLVDIRRLVKAQQPA